jgi:hypothetical protein
MPPPPPLASPSSAPPSTPTSAPPGARPLPLVPSILPAEHR